MLNKHSFVETDIDGTHWYHWHPAGSHK